MNCIMLYERFNKTSHKDAIESANKLLSMVQKDIDVQVFQMNILQDIQIDISLDIIITDVPYGDLATWQGGAGSINRLMESLAKICTKETIVAICSDKKQKISYERFKRLEKQNIGKRRFEIFKLTE